MTLAEFLRKHEGVLSAAPRLAADLLDMVQDERADEREQNVCALAGVSNDYDKNCDHYYYVGYKQGIVNGIAAIRNRNEKEVG